MLQAKATYTIPEISNPGDLREAYFNFDGTHCSEDIYKNQLHCAMFGLSTSLPAFKELGAT